MAADRAGPVRGEGAETVALQALAWLAGDDEMLGMFLGATGTAPADLRDRAGDPEFLAAILDFVLMDDRWVGAFCAHAGLDPGAPLAARAALPGGAQTYWT